MTLHYGIPLTLIGAFLQAAVIVPLWPLAGKPDLVPVIVLLWAALDRQPEGLVWSFIGGFFIDIFSGLPIGGSSALLVIIAVILGTIETRVYRSNIWFLLVSLGFGLLLFHFGQIALSIIFNGSAIPLRYTLLNITLPALLFDVILAAPLSWLLGLLYERTHPRGVKI